MDEKQTGSGTPVANEQSTLNPLLRVFRPIEKRRTDGHLQFQTIDHQKYVRDSVTGQVRRIGPPEPRTKKARRKLRTARKVEA